MRYMIRAGLLLTAASLLFGCDALTRPAACLLVAFPPAINVSITDVVGRPQALGAVATFIGGPRDVGDSTRSDSLVISGGDYNSTYDIYVTKPYYNTTVLRGVHSLHGNTCSAHVDGQVTVPATISLAPGAPAVRSLFLDVGNTTLDRGRNIPLGLFVDAATPELRAVHWRMTGDTASATLDSATNTLLYRCQVHSGLLTVTATSAANPALSDSVRIAIQGHPAAPTDPPCP